MTREPHSEELDPAGGRPAERLRQHLHARFPNETVEEIDRSRMDEDDEPPPSQPADEGDERPRNGTSSYEPT